MAYSALTTAETASGKPWAQAKTRKLKDNFDYLYGLIGSSAAVGIPNGSFEIDADADGVPDSWTKNLYAGGTGGFYTTSPASGAQSYYFTHPGGASNGGGYLTSDYIECSTLLNYIIAVTLWSTAAGMKNKVQVQFYTKAKAANGAAVDLYNSVANPTAAKVFLLSVKPTASSAYFKVILVGGFTDTDVAGTTYFDDVQLLDTYHNQAIIAGDMPIVSLATERSAVEVAYTKKKEVRILQSGTYRIYFTLRSAVDETTYGRIYKNGVAFGTERSTTGTASVVYSEDLAFIANDLIQLYCKHPGAGGGYVKNFNVNIPADPRYGIETTD